MKVSEFWNQAFLAALARVPSSEAKEEADAATDLCLRHWRGHSCNLLPQTVHFSEMSIHHACLHVKASADAEGSIRR